MVGWPHRFATPGQALVASLDDSTTGSHRAYLGSDDSTVSWTLGGRFVRSFRADNAGKSPLEASTSVDHIIFTRFKEEGSSDPAAYAVALCIFRSDQLVIHYYSGEEFCVMLPFGVRAAHSLHGGILVQSRATQDCTDSGLFAADMPTLFSLSSPRSEFKVLGLNRTLDLDRIRGQRDSLFILSPAPATSDDLGSSIPAFSDSNSILVGTAVGRIDATSQYVLCWDASLRRHVIYQCIVLSRQLDNNDNYYSSDTDTSFGVLPSRAVGADRGHLSASRPGLNRQPSMSAQRRSSAAVSAAAMAATSRRKSRYSSAAKNDRRSSLLGRVLFNDSPGANYAADVFREQRPTRAEIILHQCWTERRQRGEPRATDAMSAQLFVIQSAAGDDVLCVFYRDIGQVVGLETLGFNEIFRHSARSAAPVRAIRPETDDLLIVTGTGYVALAFGDGEEPVVLSTPLQGQISQIRHIEGALATLATVTEHDEVVIPTHVPVSRLVLSVLDSLSFVMSVASCSQLRRCVIASVCQAKDNQAQLERLALLLIRGDDKGDPAVVLGARAKKELRDRAAAALYALHLVFEDAAMYKAESVSQLHELGQLLALFAQQHGVSRAKQFYEFAGFRSDSAGGGARGRQRADCNIPSLPLFAQWALSLASSDMERLRPFPSLGSIAELFSLSDCKPVRGALHALKLLDAVTDILFQLRANCRSPLVLQRLAADKAPLQMLLQLTPELRWLVGAVMEQSRKMCSSQWPPSVLVLLERQDLVANFGCASVNTPCDSRQSLQQTIGDQANSGEDAPTENKSIVELCEEALGLLSRKHAGNSGSSSRQSAESKEFSSVSFSRDLRVEEADQLLQLTTTTYTNCQLSFAATAESLDSTEGAKALYMDQLACRTLALPVGRALFDYGTQNLSPQYALAITSPRVVARFRGHKADTVWTVGNVDTSWSLFHSGVAAALSIERSQVKSVHPSWILLNWPSELTLETETSSEDDQQKRYRDSLALHAGFLLGMGLLSGHNGSEASSSQIGVATPQPQQRGGPLCGIPLWQTFRYLTIRHGLTSIALLLGLACAHRGTMNSDVSRVLSLHIPSLLPPRSSERMLLSYGTQAAAMLGLGLLFMRSQNRRMVEVMLCELSSIKKNPHGKASSFLDSSDPAESTVECCSLASGFALGLVVLGQGLSTQTLADLQLLDTLSEMMSSNSTGSHAVRVRDEPALDDIGGQGLTSGGGAISDLGLIAALGLAFLGTDYAPAAQRLALPTVLQQLRTADPFVLLWKSLMRSLVMLSSIRPTQEWVEANMPMSVAAMPDPMPADLCRVRLNVVSAACFALALKYAGTEDRAAHSTILAYFDELETIASKPMLGYEPSLTRACAQACLDILCVSAALVMAGSGHVATMARLRALHGVSASRLYGNHMASNMALGILFIGGGTRFTIARSHDSIAMLVIALFPRFPQHYADSSEHLQACRHIWALCVEPRCLVVRDVTTGKICRNATVAITRWGLAGTRETETVVPPVPFQLLAGATLVKLQARGYLPLELDHLHPVVAGQRLSARHGLYMQPGVASARGHSSMLEQYREWLTSAHRCVMEVAERLSAIHFDIAPDVLDGVSIAEAIHSILRIRMCVQFSRYISALPSSGAAEGWAEATYATWMSVREKVLAIAGQSSSQSIVMAYWTGSQVPNSSPPRIELFYAVVGLLGAALDLPSPAHAMELTKHIPIRHLLDYVITP